MSMFARFFGASAPEQDVADDSSGSKLVVRNTFFELVETRPAARSAAFRRAKTDTLLLEKEGPEEEYLCGVSTDDDTAESGHTTAESENDDEAPAGAPGAGSAAHAVAVPVAPGLVNGKPAGRPAAPPKSRGEKPKTTVMLRNLPNNYTRDMLLELLDQEGFEGQYDFVYLPMDFKSNAGLGYAFVNLVDPDEVPRFWKALDGYKAWTLPTSKVCEVGWSDPHQGLKANIQRYRNSPVMHESVPDECKPVLLVGGVRTQFPKPNKALQAPRRRARH